LTNEPIYNKLISWVEITTLAIVTWRSGIVAIVDFRGMWFVAGFDGTVVGDGSLGSEQSAFDPLSFRFRETGSFAGLSFQPSPFSSTNSFLLRFRPRPYN